MSVTPNYNKMGYRSLTYFRRWNDDEDTLCRHCPFLPFYPLYWESDGLTRPCVKTKGMKCVRDSQNHKRRR